MSSSSTETESIDSLQLEPHNHILTGFSNEKVLQSILSHLPFEDVASCSLVQKQWNAVATSQRRTWKLFKILIQISSLHEEIEEESDDSRLVLKIAAEDEIDVLTKFYSAVTLDRLDDKLHDSTTGKKVVWLVLNIKESTPKPAIRSKLKRLFEMVRPFLTRLVLDGCGLEHKLGDDPTNFLLLDAPQLQRIHFRVPFKHLTISLPLTPLTQVRILSFPQDPGCAPTDAEAGRAWGTLAAILEATPNLKRILQMPLHPFFFLKDGEELDLEFLDKVKSIGYQLRLSIGEKNDELTILSKIAGKLKLESLVIKWYEENTIVRVSDWKECFENFSRILQASCQSLERVDIHNTSFVPYLNIPTLPALRTLALHSKGIDEIKVFPHFPQILPSASIDPDKKDVDGAGVGDVDGAGVGDIDGAGVGDVDGAGVGDVDGAGVGDVDGVQIEEERLEVFELSTKFPGLYRLEIYNLSDSLTHLDALLPPKIFEKDGNSVQQLKLRDRGVKNFTIFKEIVRKLAGYFDGIQILNVGSDWSWLEEFLPSIWMGWPNLRELTTEILSKDREGRRKCLDEVITGIPEGRCRELRKCRKKVDIDLGDYRSLPAVSNMRHLRRWSILCPDGFRGERSSPPMLTHVSTFYGFQMVPDLVVDLRVSTDVPRNTSNN